MHSGKIRTYEKKKEKVVFDLLTYSQISFDHNVGIEFCGTSETKTRAFADFVIHIGKGILILEVDEVSHRLGHLKSEDTALVIPKCEGQDFGYNVKCEQSRMMEIVNAIRLSGETQPIAFLRYNPDNFTIDEKTAEVDQTVREQTLLKFIDEWTPKLDFEIHYYCYDMYSISDVKRCCVWEHKDFDSKLQDCVFIVPVSF